MTAKKTTDKPKCKHAQTLGRMAKGKPKRFTEAYIAKLTERLAGARAKRAEKLAKGRAI